MSSPKTGLRRRLVTEKYELIKQCVGLFVPPDTSHLLEEIHVYVSEALYIYSVPFNNVWI